VSSFMVDSVDAFYCYDLNRDLIGNTAINATCPMETSCLPATIRYKISPRWTPIVLCPRTSGTTSLS
jgi:hypothetical protein